MPSSKRLQQQAFSLVEVTMALGILSFAAIAILGMVPVGVGQLRSTMDTTIQQQVIQGLVNDAQLANFSDLTSAGYEADFPAYYDDQGLRVPTEDEGIYKAEVDVRNDVNIPVGSGVSSDSAVRGNLAHVTIRVFSNLSSNELKAFSTSVADNGR